MDTSLQNVKNLVRDLCKIEYKNMKVLSLEQMLITPTISDMTLSLFSEIKINTPSYTIQNNAELKRYKIEELEEEEPSPKISSFLRTNSYALYEVVAYRFFGKKKYYETENHMFYLKVYSKYCEDDNDIFVVSKSKKLWVVTDCKTDELFVDYINKYYCEIPESISEEINNLFNDKTKEHDEIQSILKSISEELSKEAHTQISKSFKNGAITFMDFLGWKGLWQSRGREGNHLEKVSQLINQIKEKIQQETCDLFLHTENMEISKFLSISDTIAIFTPLAGTCKEEEIIKLHVRIAKFILQKCVEEQYAIRGAITFGMYNIKDNIMIGPGIDECASWHETCDWIGVHLTPSAELRINCLEENEKEGIITYKVPVKKGYPNVKYCVDWEVKDEIFRQLTDGAKALLPEISSKYMNTYAFLHRKEENTYGKNDFSKERII